ncbi:MAG: serine/threonine protein kinase [Myxococcaceae bacterium]|nr:serine/threonine protein kinase [Myxococcaceae bacterium]
MYTPDSLVLAGRFRVVRPLAQGGMGDVYLAEQVSLQRRVALKVLRQELQQKPGMAERFEREAQLLCSVDHPAVVRIIDAGQDDGARILVMEYAEGRTLASLLAAGPLEMQRVVPLLLQLAEGLCAIHAAGIIHRDLKPENVVLVPGPVGDQAKLLDFGIARLAEASHDSVFSQAGVVLGTPEYVSPEQATGARVDFRSDLYALGLLAYRCLTGALPFAGPTPRDFLTQHVGTLPTPPSVMRPSLLDFPALCALVMRCLEKDPARRPASARDVVEALRGPGIAMHAGRGSTTDVLATEPPVPAFTLGQPGELRATSTEPLWATHSPLPLGEGKGEGAVTPFAITSLPQPVEPAQTHREPENRPGLDLHVLSRQLVSVTRTALAITGRAAASALRATASALRATARWAEQQTRDGTHLANFRIYAATPLATARAAFSARLATARAAFSALPPRTRLAWLTGAALALLVTVAATTLKQSTATRVQQMLETKQLDEALSLLDAELRAGAGPWARTLKAQVLHAKGRHREELSELLGLTDEERQEIDAEVLRALAEDFGRAERSAALSELLTTLPARTVDNTFGELAREEPSLRQWGALLFLEGTGRAVTLDLADLYVRALDMKECHVRAAAARRLGELGDADAVAPLTRMRDEKSKRPCGQEEAAVALRTLERNASR